MTLLLLPFRLLHRVLNMVLWIGAAVGWADIVVRVIEARG